MKNLRMNYDKMTEDQVFPESTITRARKEHFLETFQILSFCHFPSLRNNTEKSNVNW